MTTPSTDPERVEVLDLDTDDLDAQRDAFHTWADAEAARHRAELAAITADERAELLGSLTDPPPDATAGVGAVLAWLERHAAEEDLGQVADAVARARVLLAGGLPTDTRNELSSAVHHLARGLGLLAARPFFTPPPEARTLTDGEWEDRYGAAMAEAHYLTERAAERFLDALDRTAAVLDAAAARHLAQADELDAAAADELDPAAAADLKRRARDHRAATAALAGLAAAFAAAADELRHRLDRHRRSRSHLAARPPGRHRPRVVVLCGHAVTPTASPLAPNAPPARAARVRCAATSAA
jgi:hypothetical protein